MDTAMDDIVVASGPNWTLEARVEGHELVYELSTPGGASGTKGSLESYPEEGNFIDWGGHVSTGGPFYIRGTTSPEVYRVLVVLNEGEPIEVQTVGQESGLPVLFYVAELPLGARPLAVVALDDDGEELERLDTSLALEV